MDSALASLLWVRRSDASLHRRRHIRRCSGSRDEVADQHAEASEYHQTADNLVRWAKRVFGVVAIVVVRDAQHDAAKDGAA